MPRTPRTPAAVVSVALALALAACGGSPRVGQDTRVDDWTDAGGQDSQRPDATRLDGLAPDCLETASRDVGADTAWKAPPEFACDPSYGHASGCPAETVCDLTYRMAYPDGGEGLGCDAGAGYSCPVDAGMINGVWGTACRDPKPLGEKPIGAPCTGLKDDECAGGVCHGDPAIGASTCVGWCACVDGASAACPAGLTCMNGSVPCKRGDLGPWKVGLGWCAIP